MDGTWIHMDEVMQPVDSSVPPEVGTGQWAHIPVSVGASWVGTLFISSIFLIPQLAG